MRKALLYLLSIFILSGCVMSSAPENDAEFSEKSKLNDFVGCYINIGESGEDGPNKLLSNAIWPNNKEIEHKKIKHINVQLIAGNTLDVEAKSGTEIIHSSTFVNDKDFTINKGLITIKSELLGSLAGESGNPFIGVARGSTTIGLDQNGNGKMSNTATFAGTAFIFIPLAGHVDSSIRFVKSKTECN